MARPKKVSDVDLALGEHKDQEGTVYVPCPVQDDPVEKVDELTTLALAQVVELGIGVHLLGSNLSLRNQKGNTLALTSIGVTATSGKNKTKIFIPYSNIRAIKLL